MTYRTLPDKDQQQPERVLHINSQQYISLLSDVKALLANAIPSNYKGFPSIKRLRNHLRGHPSHLKSFAHKAISP